MYWRGLTIARSRQRWQPAEPAGKTLSGFAPWLERYGSGRLQLSLVSASYVSRPGQPLANEEMIQDQIHVVPPIFPLFEALIALA